MFWSFAVYSDVHIRGHSTIHHLEDAPGGWTGPTQQKTEAGEPSYDRNIQGKKEERKAKEK